MNTTSIDDISQENTDRLIARAAKLGYIIEEVNLAKDYRPITCRPNPEIPYLPEVHYTAHGGWTVSTTSYGNKGVDEVELIAEGYQRAAALIRAFTAENDLAPYTR